MGKQGEREREDLPQTEPGTQMGTRTCPPLVFTSGAADVGGKLERSQQKLEEEGGRRG